MSGYFADDHRFDIVRGHKKPGMTSAVKELETRATWLSNKIVKLKEKYGEPSAHKSPHMRELVALLKVIDNLEQRGTWPPVRNVASKRGTGS